MASLLACSTRRAPAARPISRHRRPANDAAHADEPFATRAVLGLRRDITAICIGRQHEDGLDQ